VSETKHSTLEFETLVDEVHDINVSCYEIIAAGHAAQRLALSVARSADYMYDSDKVKDIRAIRGMLGEVLVREIANNA